MRESSEIALEDGTEETSVDSISNEDTTDDAYYLSLVSSAYETSTDYMSSNLRTQWERNYSNFLSRHPSGSKYRSNAYKHKSRLFRPKSRATERSKEAALVTAFFSTSDAVDVSSPDQTNIESISSARVWKEVLNLRLKKTINWFKTIIGAFQTAHVIGTVISYQSWDYEQEEYDEYETTNEYIPELGEHRDVETKVKKSKVIKDEPRIDLVENENFRIDPAADWMDPINSSPYVIHLIPMYIIDVMDRMEREDPKTGQPRWNKLDKGKIYAYGSDEQDTDSVRQSREGDRRDPLEEQSSDISEHKIVWVYRNIFKIPGKGDMVFYTLGKRFMLTDPVPLEEVYLHGMRPYTMGHTIIEAFRNYPTSVTELGQDVQAATNDNQNQRFDNIRQVLNKRYFVKRGSTADLRSLRRNVSGSITLMNDPERDVKVHETGDITASSYQEQNMFNADFDEISGAFSASTVQTNKQLGETVGGMRMLKDPSNIMTEYVIKTFALTWVQSTLDQLLALERAYETDDVILKAAGRNAKVDRLPENMMNADMDLSVNVGYGVTDPQARITRLLFGMETVSKLAPKLAAKIKDDEVSKEIYGILGYDDGSRFYMTDEELKDHQQANPAPPSEVDKQIASDEKKMLAQLQSKENIAAADIQSQERRKAADLKLQYGNSGSQANIALGKEAIEIEKLNLDKLGLKFKREDTLRKDSEIKDKETPTLDRSSGGNNVAK